MPFPTRQIEGQEKRLVKAQVFDIFDQVYEEEGIEDLSVLAGARPTEPRFRDDTFYIYTTGDLVQPTGEFEDPAETKKTFKGEKRINPVKYTQSYVISREAIYWLSRGDRGALREQFDEARDLMYALKRRMMQTLTRVFTEGFNTNFQATVTGEPLFSDSHSLVESSLTNDNSMGNTPLTPDSFARAHEKLNSMKNDRGEPMGSSGDPILMVGPRLEYYAKTLLNSQGIMNTDNLADNPFSGSQFFKNDYLTDGPDGDYSYYWFLIDRRRAQRLFRFIDAMPLEMHDEDVFMKGMRTGISRQWEYLFTDYQWVVGANADSRNNLSESYS